MVTLNKLYNPTLREKFPLKPLREDASDLMEFFVENDTFFGR
jgi:hypothetical protein